MSGGGGSRASHLFVTAGRCRFLFRGLFRAAANCRWARASIFRKAARGHAHELALSPRKSPLVRCEGQQIGLSGNRTQLSLSERPLVRTREIMFALLFVSPVRSDAKSLGPTTTTMRAVDGKTN